MKGEDILYAEYKQICKNSDIKPLSKKLWIDRIGKLLPNSLFRMIEKIEKEQRRSDEKCQ